MNKELLVSVYEKELLVPVYEKELLVPVGNMESLYQAIHNGADAVYLGGKDFGARKFAVNFDREEMIKAIHFCHLYGVKIYVTVNTLIYSDEVESFLDYIKFLYQNHVDAVIMQDFGMICLVREIFPDLEIHASTQMHNHNKQGLEFLKELGVKRVVLARELTLSEINKLDVDIEKEVFIHGALCICYSGCCLFSSLVGNRSGNRGECAGSCRLPYTLLEDGQEIDTNGKYLLSPKELATYPNFIELMESDIKSFKIEGRMKSPEYVGFITRFYRNLIDQYMKTKQIKIEEKDILELQTLFTRGFTKGHLFKDTNEQLMNIKTPNHIGRKIGDVIDIKKDKIIIRLSDDLNQEDGIRFLKSDKGFIVNYLYNQKGLLISEAKKNDIIQVDNKVGLTKKDIVHKTIDSKLIKQLKEYSYRKIKVSMKVEAMIGKPFTILLKDNDDFEVTIKSNIVEEAKTSSMSKEKLIDQLSKLGNTPFTLQDIDVLMDQNIFLSIKKINDARREAVDLLIEKRSLRNKKVTIKDFELSSLKTPIPKNTLTVSVHNEEQLVYCLTLDFDRIYVRDYNLYQKYKNDKRIIYQMPRVSREQSLNFEDRLLVTELGGLSYRNTNSISVDYSMNAVNHYTLYYLEKYGVDLTTLSIELNVEQTKSLIDDYRKLIKKEPNIEKIIYGRVDMMIMKHCLLNHLVNEGKRPCSICRNGKKYTLKDRKDINYPIFTENEITHILSSKIDRMDELSLDKKNGIHNFKLILFDENIKEIKILYDRFLELIKK